MLTCAEVTEIMTCPNKHEASSLLGCCNKLYESFIEAPFMVGLTDHNESPNSGYAYQPVFIFFILAKPTFVSAAARKQTEVMLKKLLKEADTPITIINGAIVSASLITFYRYDRKLDVYTRISSTGGVFRRCGSLFATC
jgi:hypothetical protein